MLWRTKQPPERYRPHYFFILACISTSSFFSTRASRPSVLSLKKTSIRHSIISVYSCTSCLRPPMSTRPLSAHFGEKYTVCVCPMSSCLKLSTVYTRLLNVSLLAWNYQKHIAQTDGRLCVCYIVLPSSISRVPRAHILISSRMRVNFCSIRPMFVPFFPFFCTICLIFVVKSGYLPGIDALGAFRQEENFPGSRAEPRRFCRTICGIFGN